MMINYSIIIPHYNTPDLLRRCVNSIPQREDVQVIVVDDNSPGNEVYLSTIPELSRPGVEYYVTKDGLSAGHARNIGLSHAKGKWLIFSDSDDFFVDDFSEILDQYVDSSHDVIYFNIRSCDCYKTDKIIKSKNKERLFSTYKKNKDELIFRVGYTEPWGKMIRRQLVITNGICFQETKGHNDLLFSVKVGLKANTILVVDRPLYWYVIREGSMGHQKGVEPIDKIKDRALAWKATQEYLASESIMTKMYLPAIPCIRAIKKDVTIFPKIMRATKEIGCDNMKIIRNILLYYFQKIIGKACLGIDQQLLLKNRKTFKTKDS